MRLYPAIAALLVGIAAALPTPLTFVPGLLSYGGEVAPLHVDESVETIPGSYIVVLKQGTPQQLFQHHHTFIQSIQTSVGVQGMSQGVRHIYHDGSMLGYAGSFSPDVLAYIRALPEVAFVEADSVVRAPVEPDMRAYNLTENDTTDSFPWPDWSHITENGSPWGLARISHRKSLTLGTFNKYVYHRNAGEGVVAYIIDTGINVDHEDFGGRAVWGKTIPEGDVDKDGHGHGTHCAGTIGSATYGVAKRAELVAVKVLRSNGSGSMSDVTAGVLWAVADARNRTKALQNSPYASRRHRGFVANMSLGGTRSPTLEMAVNGAVASGLNMAVAAGNEDQDACNVSPANAERPVTVGASTIRDERAFFSNWGKCVDIFAPGLSVVSTWNGGPRSIAALSGTSMATPHIVGLMAYLLSICNTDEFRVRTTATNRSLLSTLRALLSIVENRLPFTTTMLFPSITLTAKRAPIANTVDPRELKNALVRMSTRDALAGLDDETHNRLAFNNATHV